MTVRAKFRVDVKKETFSASGGEKVYALELYPATGDTPENKAFYKWTPGGKIELSIINKGAADQLEVGKYYYVDFTQAD